VRTVVALLQELLEASTQDRLPLKFTFPQRKNSPPLLTQSRSVIGVSHTVSFNFRKPVGAVRFRNPRASFAVVTEKLRNPFAL